MKELLIISALLIFLFNYGNSENSFGDNQNTGIDSDDSLLQLIYFLLS
jgi:hypothetical protein